MTTYTTTLGARDPDKLRLTKEEAEAMAREGFRFSEFDRGPTEFRLSLPYRIIQNLERGTLTFMQDEGR